MGHSSLINGDNHAVPVKLGSEEGQKVLDYMRQISEDGGLTTQYTPDGPTIAGYQAVRIA